MGWFSNDTEKSTLARNPTNVDVTKQYGSGAEQDRLGARFGPGDKLAQEARSGFESAKDSAERGYGQAKDAAKDGYERAKNAAERGYDQAKDSVERGYSQTKDAAQRGYGQAKDAAEQGYDKLVYTAEHGYERGKEALDRAIKYQGNGAEQDSYGKHFDYSTLDLAPVTKAALSIVKHGGDLSKASAHGLGHDGWQRAKLLAAYKGTGAEQDRYEARFGRAAEAANSAIKDKINELRR